MHSRSSFPSSTSTLISGQATSSPPIRTITTRSTGTRTKEAVQHGWCVRTDQQLPRFLSRSGSRSAPLQGATERFARQPDPLVRTEAVGFHPQYCAGKAETHDEGTQEPRYGAPHGARV